MTIIIGEWARFLGERGWLPRIGDRNAFGEGDKHAIFKSVDEPEERADIDPARSWIGVKGLLCWRLNSNLLVSRDSFYLPEQPF
jgi:hypothetical protein